VLGLATVNPCAPVKTVVKIIKLDGSLENTRETSTEPTHEALGKMKQEQYHHDRHARLVASGKLYPGLLFLPH
jgi:hypothetical protein